jgi:hypothetical protein
LLFPCSGDRNGRSRSLSTVVATASTFN